MLSVSVLSHFCCLTGILFFYSCWAPFLSHLVEEVGVTMVEFHLIGILISF